MKFSERDLTTNQNAENLSMTTCKTMTLTPLNKMTSIKQRRNQHKTQVVGHEATKTRMHCFFQGAENPFFVLLIWDSSSKVPITPKLQGNGRHLCFVFPKKNNIFSLKKEKYFT